MFIAALFGIAILETIRRTLIIIAIILFCFLFVALIRPKKKIVNEIHYHYDQPKAQTTEQPQTSKTSSQTVQTTTTENENNKLSPLLLLFVIPYILLFYGIVAGNVAMILFSVVAIVIIGLFINAIFQIKKANKEKTNYTATTDTKSTAQKEHAHNDKGTLGEMQVNTLLLSLNPVEYHILHNLLLKTEKGTSQIDHVIVSLYGIFVIETKNHAGTIYVNETASTWTEYKHGQRYDINNPIRQNYGHVMAIKDTIKTDIPVVGIVAFSDEADLKIDQCQSKVIHFSQIIETVKEYTTEAIDREQLAEITEALFAANTNDEESVQEHIENIQVQQKINERLIAAGRCPKCYEKLVKKSGQHGEFLACSAYPKCKFTTKPNETEA